MPTVLLEELVDCFPVTAQSHPLSYVSTVNICIVNQYFIGGKKLGLAWSIEGSFLKSSKK